jgi:putative ABC transport system permease protein
MPDASSASSTAKLQAICGRRAMLLESVRLALRAIGRSKLRSFLTVLGIIIGVAAVIAMVTIGKGTTAKVTADLAKLGANLLSVNPGQFGPGRASADARSFNVRDIEAMRSQLNGIRAVAPVAQKTVTVIYGSDSRSIAIVGTDNDYLVTQDWLLTQGREFYETELRGGRAACIVGATVVRKLFGGAEGIGRNIRVASVSCEVIGVLEAKGQSGFGMDQDDTILMPIRTFQRRLAGSSEIGRIMVAAEHGGETTKVQRAIELLLRERRNITPGKEDDFSVLDMRQIAQAMAGTTTLLTGLLAAVAAVSLLVGGIGIMNIMLVSVTERTREIGIRLAIGASRRQVLSQFLVEAIMLSILGGVTGIGLGLGLALLVTGALQVPFVLDPATVLLAFAFSALVGVCFGYLPARQAAQLNPIEALRHE